MLAGVAKWEAAGFLGMNIEMLDPAYGQVIISRWLSRICRRR